MKTFHDIDAAVLYARMHQILRDCRIVHLTADELARIRSFFSAAGIHPKAHVPLRSVPVPCDPRNAAMPLRAAA